jgi:uncharacterized protein YjbI with pentapeptide repeats
MDDQTFEAPKNPAPSGDHHASLSLVERPYVMAKSLDEIIKNLKAQPRRWAAFQDWWDEDWSWEGLPSNEQLGRPPTGKATLQDYWRDQEGELIEFAGRRWTAVHLPPCNRDGTVVSEQWPRAKGEVFWRAIEERLPSVSLPIKDTIFVEQIDPTPALFYGVVFPEWKKDQGERIISAFFEKCLFLGWCSFSRARIANSFFDDARFIGDAAYFDDAEFLRGGHFSRVKILCSPSTFSKAKFRGSASFRESELNWPNFHDAIFEDGCDFSDALLVDSGAHFVGSEFNGGYAHFDRVHFDGVADFSFAKFNSVASFTDVEFKYDAYFRCDKGGKFAAAADFNGTAFHRTADFSGRSFEGTTDFRGAKFGGLPMFYDCELARETLFDGGNFNTQLWRKPIDDSSIERTLEDEERERIRRRQIRFNDIRQRMGGKDDSSSKVSPGSTWNRRAKSYELAFRTLRQLSAAAGNVDEEMDFHSLELGARSARSDVSRFERCIILLYGWLSDYGRSMWRPIWVFLALATVTVTLATPITVRALDEARLRQKNIEVPSNAEVGIYIARNFIPPPPVWSENLGRTWASGFSDRSRMLLSLVGTLQTLVFTGLAALFLIAMRRRFRIRD